MNDKQLYLSGFQKKNQKKDKNLILMLSLDKIILFSVVIVILLTLTFSIGVENGKKIASLNNIYIDKTIEDHYINQESKTVLETTDNFNSKNESKSINKNSILDEIAANTTINPDLSNAQNESIVNNNETEITINTAAQNTNKISYTIQVASFRKKNSARQEADLLKKQGYPVSLIQKGKYVVVCVGTFKKPIEAKNRLNSLKKKYKDCLLRRL